jgi:HAD superfamily phosphatase (TIGR01668 family)
MLAILKPTYLIDGDLTDVDLDQLYADGIKGIILDLDSTLVAPRSGKLTPQAANWLEKAKSRFKLAVVSNNKNEPYMQQVKALLDMPVLGKARKPSTKVFVQAMKDLGLNASDCVAVGDRPLTDVWGGQRAGMKTALVFPLKTMNEPSWVTFFRKLERCFIKT